MRTNHSESHLFTEAEEQQLQLGEDSERGLRPSSEPRLWQQSGKLAPRPGTSPQGESTPTAPMPNEELADLLAEALQGHRAVLEELVSMREHLTQEATLVRTAVGNVAGLMRELLEAFWEEEDDAKT